MSLEAIAIKLEAIALRLKAIAISNSKEYSFYLIYVPRPMNWKASGVQTNADAATSLGFSDFTAC